jgi:drug/metabolite transporter (DMT)-like permease
VVDAPIDTTALEEAPERRRTGVGYALVVGGTVLWSVNATVAKVAIEAGEIPAVRMAELRTAGAGALMLAAAALLRPATLKAGRGELAFLAVFGIVGLALVQVLYFTAIERLDIGTALVIEYTAPVLVAAWARVFEHEPVRRRLWYALALALAGLALVVELPRGVTLDGLGVAAATAGAFTYALYVVMADRSLKRGRDVFSLLALGFAFGALFWTVAQPWWSFPWERMAETVSLLGRLDSVSAPVWGLASWVVVLGTIVPFLLIVGALHHLSPTRVVIIAMLEPVISSVIAYAWLEEELTEMQIGGGILVLAAVVLAETARTRPATMSD